MKRLIDQMGLLKMNVLHWHLSDDAGWRIQIKKYPKLTSVGYFLIWMKNGIFLERRR